LVSIFRQFVDVIAVFLAATVEDNILSYEPVITQECKFLCSFAIYSAVLVKPVLVCV